MPEWRLTCLGSPRLAWGGEPVKLEMRKALALLIYLRVANKACSRAVLETLLWPEYDPRHAQANLRRVLASLNTGQTRGLLAAEREAVGLSPAAGVWLDADAFQQGLEGYRTDTGGLDALQAALDLYQGDFLEDFYLKDCPLFEDWQGQQRDHLRRELAGGLQAAAAGYAAQARWEPAIACARRWAALDDLHEPAQRLLIGLYEQAGQRQAALQQYAGLIHLLQERLCQAPEPATLELGRRLQPGLPAAAHPWQAPLLKTKLYLPRSRGRKVPRSRLVQQLHALAAYPLTVVSAPAGFGKTTTLLSWVEQSAIPVAWVSLDREDNDLLRFLHYLTAAVHNLHADESLQAPLVSQNAPVSVLLAGLLQEIEAMGEPFVLILDDYQFITAPAVHEALAFLLDHLPGPLHLVIATRVDPPLPLARLRAAGQLLELRADNLRFTIPEAGAFLNQVMDLDLPPAEVDCLEERTEGWIAGLQMAALSLRNRPDHARFIRDFSGSNRYILDYLAEQVLDRLPAALRKFLFQTSVLERLSGELCDAVTQVRTWPVAQEGQIFPGEGSPLAWESQAILEYLEHANLFIACLDDDRRWYRYHHLFADLLRARLKQSEPGSVPLLQTRASEWYEQQGLVVEAVSYAHAARDYHRIARLVARNAIQMGASFQVYPLAQCIKLLPESMVFANPWFCILSAWDHVTRGRMQRAVPLLDTAEKALRRETWAGPGGTDALAVGTAGSSREMLGLIAALRANIAEAFDQEHETIILAHRAFDLLGPQAANMRSSVNLMLGRTALKQGNFQPARQWLHAVLHQEGQADRLTYLAPVAVTLAAIEKIEGQLDCCQARLHQAAGEIEQVGYERVYASGLVYQALAELLLEKADLPAAERYACQGLQQNRHWGNLNAICQGLLVLARLRMAQGDLAQARTRLYEAESLDPDFTPFRETLSRLYAARVQLALAGGDVAAAVRLEQAYRQPGLWSPLARAAGIWDEYDAITAARVHLALGEPGAALERLSAPIQAAESAGRLGWLSELRSLQAEAGTLLPTPAGDALNLRNSRDLAADHRLA